MASPALLDFESLLKPIAADAPAGVDLRAESSGLSSYHEAKDARRAARESENLVSMEVQTARELAEHWMPLLELAPRILREQSKDLQVAAWYTEALARSAGFAGLRDGFRLIGEYVDKLWDHLYPRPDEVDGFAVRVSPLTGLNGEDADGALIPPIGMIAITEATEHGTFATWHYKQARELARVTDAEQREQRLSAGVVPIEKFEAAVRASSKSFYTDLVEDLNECIKEFQALGKMLDQRCGAQSPPTSNIRRALEEVLETVKFVAKDALADGSAGQASESAGQAGGSFAAALGGGGPIGSRADAVRTLRAIADWFRRAEPHSPVPYAVEQAVRWAELPLPDLLQELIPDEGSRRWYCQVTGVKQNEPTG